MEYIDYIKRKPTIMKVQEAIQTIETLGGYKFIRRENRYNLAKGTKATLYVFDGIECLGAGCLRFYARQFNYTHGVR